MRVGFKLCEKDVVLEQKGSCMGRSLHYHLQEALPC